MGSNLVNVSLDIRLTSSLFFWAWLSVWQALITGWFYPLFSLAQLYCFFQLTFSTGTFQWF